MFMKGYNLFNKKRVKFWFCKILFLPKCPFDKKTLYWQLLHDHFIIGMMVIFVVLTIIIILEIKNLTINFIDFSLYLIKTDL